MSTGSGREICEVVRRVTLTPANRARAQTAKLQAPGRIAVLGQLTVLTRKCVTIAS